MRYAAVGTDGRRPVVWGIGLTEREAIEDARRWLMDCDHEGDVIALEVHPITPGQFKEIEEGEVAWPVLDPSAAAAQLGRRGGKAGTGEAKRRGDSAYYKALRAKAPKLCRRCRLPQEISYDHDRACTWNPHNRVSLD